MRYSDDGEPAKTSGLPTLEAIRSAGLVDCIVVTTRYFGGTLLGTGGLVRAYTAAANAVLAAAKQVTVQVCVRGVLRVEYPLYELAQRLLADAGARLEEVQFADRVTLPFVMLAGGETQLLPKLQELCRGSAGAISPNPILPLSENFLKILKGNRSLCRIVYMTPNFWNHERQRRPKACGARCAERGLADDGTGAHGGD